MKEETINALDDYIGAQTAALLVALGTSVPGAAESRERIAGKLQEAAKNLRDALQEECL